MERSLLNRGFVFSDFLLGLTLLGVLALGTQGLSGRVTVGKASKICTENVWRWIAISSEFEEKLRDWDMKASQCLQGALQPLESSPDGKTILLREVLYSAPLTRDMETARKAFIPLNHRFKTAQEVLICGDEKLAQAKIKRIQLLAKSKSAVLTLKRQEKRNPILFTRGARLVSVKVHTFSLLPGDQPNLFDLVERLTDTAKRIRLKNVERFEVSATSEANQLAFQMTFAKGACEYNRALALDFSTIIDLPLGRWISSDKGIQFVALTDRSSTVGSSR